MSAGQLYVRFTAADSPPALITGGDTGSVASTGTTGTPTPTRAPRVASGSSGQPASGRTVS